MSKKLSLKGSGGELESKETFPQTITHKIFETNSSFHLNTTGKVWFLFFKSLLLLLTKLSFWQGYWAPG